MSKTTHETTKETAWGALTVLGLALLALILLPTAPVRSEERPEVESLIIKAATVEQAAEWVEQVGGVVTHELGIINAVAADVTADQRARLEALEGAVRMYGNRTATLDAKLDNGGGNGQAVETYYPNHLGADSLHLEGINGFGVTIAVLDSGIFEDNGLTKNPDGDKRVLANYDADTDYLRTGNSLGVDAFGHGSHVASVAVSSRQTETGTFNGMAPDADLVVVHAFGETGSSTYADVIRGVDWVV